MPARATESGNLRAAARTPALIIDRAESAIWPPWDWISAACQIVSGPNSTANNQPTGA
jgi:hypothetical protein